MEWGQCVAIASLWVQFLGTFGIDIKKGFALIITKAIQQGAERRATNPFGNRVFAFQNLQIPGFPDIQRFTKWAEKIEIEI